MNCGGAHLILGLEPDIAVFAKGISNGYPVGVVIGKREFMDAAQIHLSAVLIGRADWAGSSHCDNK